MMKKYGIKLAFLVLFFTTGMKRVHEAFGMEPEDELSMYFKHLPEELQRDTRRLQLMHNAVMFLGLHDLNPLHTLANDSWVESVATNGNIVVTGSYKAAKIWNMDGRLLHTLKGGRYPVAIGGNKVVTGSNDESIKIWDIFSGQLLHSLEGFISESTSIAINNDDMMVTALGWLVTTWDMNNFSRLNILPTNSLINSVAISGDKVVTGSFKDSTAEVLSGDFRWERGVLLHKFTFKHPSSVMSVAINGDKVVTGSGDNNVRIWDLHSGQLLHILKGHTHEVRSVAISGDRVFTGSWRTVKIWDINTGQLLCTLAENSFVKSLAIAGDKVVTGSQDNTAKIWSLKLNLQGTPQDNPLLWIVEKATIPQLDFINRAYEATIAEQDLIIAMPTKLGKIQDTDSQEQVDGNIYFSFPPAVREYLRTRLSIRK